MGFVILATHTRTHQRMKKPFFPVTSGLLTELYREPYVMEDCTSSLVKDWAHLTRFSPKNT